MNPETFIQNYESALASQDWAIIEALFSTAACITFSDGTVHLGKSKIQAAYEENFRIIKSEKYAIENVNWLKKEETFAVYVFEFNWTGRVNDKLVSGSGVGTTVLIFENFRWKILSEHLGKKSMTA